MSRHTAGSSRRVGRVRSDQSVPALSNVRMLDSTKAPSRIQIATAAIRQKITAAPGVRLPSIRRLAAQLKVSKSTVVEAYDRLVAQGEVEARPGSGFFAATRVRPFKLAEERPQRDRAIDPLWIMRQSLAMHGDTWQPGCGWLPDDWLPGEMLRRILRTVARSEEANLTAYSRPQGFRPLREQLARRLIERDIAADPSEILLTDSATRAIDLVCRFLLQPGDTVLIDDPCYFNYQSTMRAQRVKLVGIPYTTNGPDLEHFAAACVEHRPKLYLTTAVLHNPTGANVSAGTAHRLLKLAEAHDLILVEDSVYTDLDAKPAPGLAALDGFERVILIGSFSKTMTAALRCGFIVARGDWIEGLTDLALATSFGINDLAAQVTHGMLIDGSYRRHLDGLRPQLARAMASTVQHLKRLGFTLWIQPDAGMFLWAQLPDGLQSADVAIRALDRRIVLAPGNVFSVTQTAGPYLRFNVAQCGDARMFDDLAELLRG
ncbi:DNA-binding transcriptional MocR family regulator [Bradyrhizobium sp. USDA 4503]